MKSSLAAHRALPWRVHTLASDFELLDVWSFDVERPVELDAFLTCLWDAIGGLGGSPLGKTRLWIGRALGWDDHDFTLPIPGCTETSVASRLLQEGNERPSPLRAVHVKTVYVERDEALYEVSNDTIHALIHVGVNDGAPTLAVYIKSRGAFSRLYMAAISPFRHLFVYPALIRRVEASYAR